MMSQTQSSTLIDEWFMDVVCVYSATFQRSSVVFCEKKHWINLSFLFVDFLRILAKAISNTFLYGTCNLRLNYAIYVQRFNVRNISLRVRSHIVALAQV